MHPLARAAAVLDLVTVCKAKPDHGDQTVVACARVRTLAIAVLLAASTSCGAAATPSRAPTTRLADGGCSVALPGTWQRLPAAAGSNRWGAETPDGARSLEVLPLPWKPTDAPSAWRADLNAVLELRREADQKEYGGRAQLSAAEFVDHPVNPAAFYVLYDPGETVLSATLVKASRKQLCVLWLTEGGSDRAAFTKVARRVLEQVAVDP